MVRREISGEEHTMDADGHIYRIVHYSDGKTKKIRMDDDAGWATGEDDYESKLADQQERKRRQIENSLKQEVITLGDVQVRMNAVFELMNWYASGEHLNRWGRTDPQSILAEVYACLAPIQLALSGMNDPNSGFAEAQYKRMLSKAQATYSKETSKLKANYDRANEEAQAMFNVRLEVIESDFRTQIAVEQARVENEIQRRVAAELARLDDIRNGERRNANGRVVRL